MTEKNKRFDGATRRIMIMKSQHNGREYIEQNKTNKQKTIKIGVRKAHGKYHGYYYLFHVFCCCCCVPVFETYLMFCAKLRLLL